MTRSRADARIRYPRHERRGEARLPAVIATVVAIGLYQVLPQQLLLGPRYVLLALELLLLVPLIAINPRRLTRQTRLSRALSLTLVLVIAASNLVSLGILIHALVSTGVKEGAPS
ncbi:hypothetical protein [Streptomyces sp. NBC_01264]|uniref:hypothetical protein n=1 Tax=Streptomyces sp. NBC_01264 TaxID=2903804 RepID=UPI0022578AC8|nr:hypothetical protein [Streptomyces sp. NBC_01264]MCX4783473.1 hypothetical protein [Streptomyces sp. NBC_01264]